MRTLINFRGDVMTVLQSATHTGPRTAAEWAAINRDPSPAVRAARTRLQATLARRRAALRGETA